MLVEKGLVCLYLLVFCSCVFIVRIPLTSASVHFMLWNPQHSPMQTKATISLENRKKMEGVKTVSWVEVSLSFLQAWLLQFWCANQSLTIFTHYFSSSYIIHIPNRNTKCYGTRMISFGFGLRGVHVFITLKSGKEVKVMVPSQSMRMPWRHNNQPVIVMVVNIENINWTYYKCYCYLFRLQNMTFLVTLCLCWIEIFASKMS